MSYFDTEELHSVQSFLWVIRDSRVQNIVIRVLVFEQRLMQFTFLFLYNCTVLVSACLLVLRHSSPRVSELFVDVSSQLPSTIAHNLYNVQYHQYHHSTQEASWDLKRSGSCIFHRIFYFLCAKHSLLATIFHKLICRTRSIFYSLANHMVRTFSWQPHQHLYMSSSLSHLYYPICRYPDLF